MRFHSPLLALAAYCLMPSAFAQAGAVFVLETTNVSGDSKSTDETRMSIEGSNVMVDIAGGAPENGGGDPDQFIFLGERGEMMVIDHAEKSYMVMDKESLKAMGAMMGGASGDGAAGGMSDEMMEAMLNEALKDVPEEQRAEIEQAMRNQMGATKPNGAKQAASPVEYRKTKEREEQQGYKSVKYVATQDGKVIREMWVTNWDNIDGGEEARDAFKAMAAFWEEAFGNLAEMSGENPIEVFEKVDGFPVVTREFSDGQLDSESVLKSAEEKELGPDTFAPPKGYTLKTMGME